jgi:hypothetical protein
MIAIQYLIYCYSKLSDMLEEDKIWLSREGTDFVNQLKNIEKDWPKKEHNCIYSLPVDIYKRYYLK